MTPHVELSTSPFTLEAGKHYIAYASLQVEPRFGSDPAAYAVGTVNEIKWQF